MSKKIIIDASFPNETRVALLNANNNIEDVEFENPNKTQNKGNIYLARVTRIEASLQAAFIDYGAEKSGFLPFSEISENYYNLPVSDNKSAVDHLVKVNIVKEESIANIVDEIKPLQIDSVDLDIKTIELLVDEKIDLNINLEVAEDEIEPINEIFPEKLDNNKYKIQDVLKKGQILLVQLLKEERGSKGASFSTYISLAGKYCVLMPNTLKQNGVSRKISHANERKRLKYIVSTLSSDNEASVIIRTAGVGHHASDITRDYNYLAKLWNKIVDVSVKSKAPCFVHQEEGMIQKALRDMFDQQVKDVLVSGNEAYNSAVKFMNDILPSATRKIKEYQHTIPIFTKFAIEEQLSNLYQPIVSLKSGGYIVINPTEALTSIDVNSGRAISESNIEETAIKTNLEAAREIARQIRLRDISGLIVIDFIDMYELRNRKIIERSLKEFLAKDKARIHTANISQFGLLEMSRQRLRPSFLETNSIMCNECSGKGVVRNLEASAILMLRTVENEIYNEQNISVVNVYANEKSIVYILNNQRQDIAYLETKYNIKLNFYLDHTSTADSYSIEKIRANSDNRRDDNSKPLLHDISDIYQHEERVNKTAKQKWRNVVNMKTEKPLDDKATATDVVSNIVEENIVSSEIGTESETANNTDVQKTAIKKKPYRRRPRSKIPPKNNIPANE